MSAGGSVQLADKTYFSDAKSHVMFHVEQLKKLKLVVAFSELVYQVEITMMNPDALIASMRMFANGAGDFVIDCQPEDRQLLVSDLPWTALDRARVSRALEALVCGALDASGLPRCPTMPSEYLAGAIAVSVAPVNVFPACHYAADRLPSRPASVGASDPIGEEPATVSTEQLLAMVLQAKSRDDSAFRRAFRTRLQIVERSIIGAPSETAGSQN